MSLMKAYSDAVDELDRSLSAPRGNLTKEMRDSGIHNMAVDSMVEKMIVHNIKSGRYTAGVCPHCGEKKVKNEMVFGHLVVNVCVDCIYDWWQHARNWVLERLR